MDKYCIWDKVFKNGPSKIRGRQPVLGRVYPFKFFKGCLPQILLGPLLNTFSHICYISQNSVSFSHKRALNSFLANAPILYPLKIIVFWCFQGV